MDGRTLCPTLGFRTTLMTFEGPIARRSLAPEEAIRDVTKFEARGQRLGHEIRDLLYRRLPLSRSPCS